MDWLIIHDTGTGISDVHLNPPTGSQRRVESCSLGSRVYREYRRVLMYVDYGLTIPKHELNEADNKDIFVARRQAINGMAGLSMMLTGLVAGRIST